jgi:hypothetical protein
VQYFGGAGTDSSNDAFITGSNFPGGGTAFFSTASPVGFQLPGIGRNSFRGPRYFDIDMTLSKKFGIFGEGRFFEVKANFFNIFNILNLQPFNFNSPSAQVTNSLFGRAEKGLAGRVIELQGRIQF